jgi:histidine triad (HIT) family protein
LATDCDFCKIVRGELSARVIYDTEDTLAFFPLQPATSGHTLVIPKRHVPDLWTVDRPLASKLLGSVLTVSQGLRNALSPDGFNIINSSGRAATQTVFHLHVHLVPRWFDDRVGDIWPPPEPWPSDTVKDDLAHLVRECIGALDPPSS